jgi:hypothetical protein
MDLLGQPSLTVHQLGVQDDGMASPNAAHKPFQFDLRSIFLATSAIALALGVLKWFGPDTFVAFVILEVQCSAVIAILVMSKGTAWRGVVFAGLTMALLAMVTRPPFLIVLIWVSLVAWLGGGVSADAETRKRSRFVRWAFLLGLAWFWSLIALGTIVILVNGPVDL